MKKTTCPVLVAIDGPAGSGKSTTARAVARRLGFRYLDTGAMYRAVALAVLQAGVDIEEQAVAGVLSGLRIGLEEGAEGMRVRLNDADVTASIRSAGVGAIVSRVSTFRAVREALVQQQRRIAADHLERGHGVVVDGRDIGTVVFPKAGVKIYMDATPEVRAERRYREREGQPGAPGYEAVLQEIVARDRIDSGRALAPLKPAEDAVRLDTSDRTFDAQVAFIVSVVEAWCAGRAAESCGD